MCTRLAHFNEILRVLSSFFFSCLFVSVAESPVSTGVQVLPQGYWYTVLYSSIILVLCLIVCLVGAHIYSRTAFAILLLITVSLLSIFISSVVVKRQDFVITHQLSGNQSVHYNTSYTGYNATTLKNNLGRECQNHMCSFSLMIPLPYLFFFFFFCSWLHSGLQHQLCHVFCYRVCGLVYQLHWDHGWSQYVRLFSYYICMSPPGLFILVNVRIMFPPP